MKKLISLLIAIVIGLSLLPVILSSAETYDIATSTESFTATEDVATAEVLTTDETIIEVSSIIVDGTALDLETDLTSATGTTVTLAVDASVADDVIVVTYTYDLEVGTAVDSLVNLLPILFTVILVVGVVVVIKFR